MEKFGRAQPHRRFEDNRFITGRGRYVDDNTPDGALFAAFVRSPAAHGAIEEMDLDAAREMPGVVAVLGPDDVPDYGMAIDTLTWDGKSAVSPKRHIFAKGRVRFVGEPMAIVVAETRDQARDAAEAAAPMIEMEDAHTALAPGGPTIHDEAPDNVAMDWSKGDWDGARAAIDAAAHVVRTRVEDNRVMVVSMEPRGCWAEWDGDHLRFDYGGQGVWPTRDEMADCFDLPKEKVRVTTPDVGGGFGMKGFNYPEYFAVAAAARAAGRPVRWMSDRTEAMLSDNGGRGLVTDTVMAFDADHRLLAYTCDTICDLGAQVSEFAHYIQTTLFAKVAQGVYDLDHIALRCRGIFTNTAPTDAYRGAGRPEAIFALERSMDNAARQLGVDPFELRRRNFIKPSQMPYKTKIAETYDVGDFARLLDLTHGRGDVAGFEARRAADAKRGLLRGMGLCYYIESILGDKEERAKIVFKDDGRVAIHVGTQSNGQGHETVYATFLSDQTGIPADLIDVVQGDTAQIETGGGTGGSRSVTIQSVATLATVSTIVKDFSAYLAAKFEAEDVGFDDERFRVPGSNETPTMLEVAKMAREDGREDLLSFDEQGTIESRSFPNGGHLAEVTIDPETGKVDVVRYTVVDDFGNMINPLLAEGQVHGGVAQGLGQAICERTVYDESGQLITASFMDYAMPRAYDMPMIAFSTEPVPSTTNPMGMKGCGEAGTVGALAAVSNAVHDALDRAGIRTDLQMPFTPDRVWRALKRTDVAAE